MVIDVYIDGFFMYLRVSNIVLIVELVQCYNILLTSYAIKSWLLLFVYVIVG